MKDNFLINSQTKCSNTRKHTSQNTQLDKMFRLYSPNQIIHSNLGQKQLKSTQKTVIQLVFPHPNLLFIHPEKIKDPSQKHAFSQLNMIKSIVQRKTRNTSLKGYKYSQKPMTAPNIGREHYKQRNINSVRKNPKDEEINIYNLIGETQKQNMGICTSTFNSGRMKALTAKSKFRSTCHTFKQNQEQTGTKEFQNKILNRNTFDFKLQEQKKTIEKKFQQQKIIRNNIFRSGLKSPKINMYITIEGKFNKYFKGN